MNKIEYTLFEENIIPVVKELVEEASGNTITIKEVPGKGEDTSKCIGFQFLIKEFEEQLFPDKAQVEKGEYTVSAVPFVSLREIYDFYKEVTLDMECMDDIAHGIMAILYDITLNTANLPIAKEEVEKAVEEIPTTKEELLDKVEAVILNWYANVDSLKYVCHRTWNDLVILYTLHVAGQPTYVLSSTADELNISEMELYQAAMKNTVKNNTVQLLPLDQVAKEEAEKTDIPVIPNENYSEEAKKYMPYVCQFEGRPFGAICFLLPGMLERIQELVGECFYVFPSSLHEVIIQPIESGSHLLDDGYFVEEWNRSLNANERLSNQVYYYNGFEFEGLYDNPAPII